MLVDAPDALLVGHEQRLLVGCQTARVVEPFGKGNSLTLYDGYHGTIAILADFTCQADIHAAISAHRDGPGVFQTGDPRRRQGRFAGHRDAGAQEDTHQADNSVHVTLTRSIWIKRAKRAAVRQ